MEDLDEHRRVLSDLVTARTDISATAARLRDFPGYDLDPLVTLGATDIVLLLERYLHGELEAEEIGIWAETLEIRDDVDFGDDEAGVVPGTVIQLASEGLGGRPLTPDVAREFVSELRPLMT